MSATDCCAVRLPELADLSTEFPKSMTNACHISESQNTFSGVRSACTRFFWCNALAKIKSCSRISFAALSSMEPFARGAPGAMVTKSPLHSQDLTVPMIFAGAHSLPKAMNCDALGRVGCFDTLLMISASCSNDFIPSSPLLTFNANIRPAILLGKTTSARNVTPVRPDPRQSTTLTSNCLIPTRLPKRSVICGLSTSDL
mmetsp:Transcript_135813/g.249281  ORF Transcript_135813/g.249281 Transcript_135813/m.249281 type:complete len:200 (+) Transcript_135813:118-717(+)